MARRYSGRAMNTRSDHPARWAYRGVWAVLTRWLHVPQEPPALPALSGEQIEALRKVAGEKAVGKPIVKRSISASP
jgi:hypothetical protein